jgi:serine/threonine protein kinase
MAHLTSEGVIHRDLAARNILLDSKLRAKISDFGLSRLGNESKVVYSKSDIGPLKWMSPEAVQKKKYSEKSDGKQFYN